MGVGDLMAQILVDGMWYEELSKSSLYEGEYEDLIIRHTNQIFPDYITVPFETTVSDDEGSKKPDLALIERNYREWWVVEVEMGRHPFNQHVLPQVKILSGAVYGEKEAEYLCKQDKSLSPDLVLDMMKGAQPQVLVIVDRPRPDWAVELRRLNAIVFRL